MRAPARPRLEGNAADSRPPTAIIIGNIVIAQIVFNIAQVYAGKSLRLGVGFSPVLFFAVIIISALAQAETMRARRVFASSPAVTRIASRTLIVAVTTVAAVWISLFVIANTWGS